jgi:DNA invertase Pin-like site-specific DNA recombinase
MLGCLLWFHRRQVALGDHTSVALKLFTYIVRHYRAKQGWTMINEYVDRVSGKRSDREQFQAMFDAASLREFDLVLFWSLDRFSH